MYSIKEHRRNVALSGVGALGVLALFVGCLVAAWLALAFVGPWATLATAAVLAGVWRVVGAPYMSGVLLPISRVSIYGSNILAAVSALVRLLGGEG